MRLKRILCIILTLIIAISSVGRSALALEGSDPKTEISSVRATGKFNLTVPANSLVQSGKNFPLEAGEVVTIRATYSPTSADVEFGVIAPDGLFYGLSAEKGAFDESFEVDQKGYYRLAVYNNSGDDISTSGFINY